MSTNSVTPIQFSDLDSIHIDRSLSSIRKEEEGLTVRDALELFRVFFSIRMLILAAFTMLTIFFAVTVISVMNNQLVRFYASQSSLKREQIVHHTEDFIIQRKQQLVALTETTDSFIKRGLLDITDRESVSQMLIDFVTSKSLSVVQAIMFERNSGNYVGFTRLVKDKVMYKVLSWSGVTPANKARLFKVIDTEGPKYATKQSYTISALSFGNVQQKEPNSDQWLFYENTEKQLFVNGTMLQYIHCFNQSSTISGCLDLIVDIDTVVETQNRLASNCSLVVVNGLGELVAQISDEEGIADQSISIVSKRIEKKGIESGVYSVEGLEGTRRYFVTYSAFKITDSVYWWIVSGESTVVTDFEIKTARAILCIIAACFVTLAIIFAFGISFLINRPLELLRVEMNQIALMELNKNQSTILKFDEIYRLLQTVAKTKKALKSFGKYVPVDVVRTLISGGKEATPGVEEYHITIYFSDIANFTNMTEKLTPVQLVEWISMYFDEMSEVIMENKGLIDKFIGDSVMAFWNAPVQIERPEYWAVRAAYECNNRLSLFNQRMRLRALPAVSIRAGLASGECLVGNLGSNSRLNYTCIGNYVNLASRLEGVNKAYKSNLIISESVYGEVLNDFICRPLDRITVQGQEVPVNIYEVQMAFHEATTDVIRSNYEYHRAFKHYLDRNFDIALERFQNYKRQFPEDYHVGVMIDRCHEFIENPPPLDWDFVYKTTK